MPGIFNILYAKIPIKTFHLQTNLEGCPIAANHTIVGNDRLEDTTIVVGMMSVFWKKHDVPALVTNEVFIIGRNQEKLAASESPRAAVICHIELAPFPLLQINGVAQKGNPSSAIADIQS